MQPYHSRLKPLARDLRRNMTDAEKRLWERLRRKQIHDVLFYRQKPLGPYIADFYCSAANLVVELDGAQHDELQHRANDEVRTQVLASLGLEVLRFNNRQVLNETDDVVTVIAENVARKLPPFVKGGLGGILPP